jgi:hypothetical protein
VQADDFSSASAGQAGVRGGVDLEDIPETVMEESWRLEAERVERRAAELADDVNRVRLYLRVCVCVKCVCV